MDLWRWGLPGLEVLDKAAVEGDHLSTGLPDEGTFGSAALLAHGSRDREDKGSWGSFGVLLVLKGSGVRTHLAEGRRRRRARIGKNGFETQVVGGLFQLPHEPAEAASRSAFLWRVKGNAGQRLLGSEICPNGERTDRIRHF